MPQINTFRIFSQRLRNIWQVRKIIYYLLMKRDRQALGKPIECSKSNFYVTERDVLELSLLLVFNLFSKDIVLVSVGKSDSYFWSIMGLPE